MDFSKKYQKAEEAYKKRNYDYAVEILLSILQMDPNQTKARSTLRAILTKKKEEGTYKQAGAFSRTGFIAKLKAMQMKRSWEQVITECDRHLSSDMDNVTVLKGLGMALMEAGHNEAGVQVFETARSIDPKDIDIYRYLARLFMKQGELKTALKFWEAALRMAPNDADIQKNVRNLNAQISSQVWEGDGDYRQKIRDEKTAANLEEEQAIIRTDEDITRALARADRSIETESDENKLSKLWRRKGELFEKRRDYAGAQEAYEKQLQYDPDAYDAPDKIGDLRMKVIDERIMSLKEALKTDASKQAELDEAIKEKSAAQIEEYRRRVKAHPTDMRHRFDLGRACMVAGNFDEAVENLQQSVNDGKLQISSLIYLAQCFSRKGLTDFAKGQCQRALDTTGGKQNDVWKLATYTMGDICERAGDTEGALKYFEQLYLVDISYRDVRARYERLQSGTPTS